MKEPTEWQGTFAAHFRGTQAQVQRFGSPTAFTETFKAIADHVEGLEYNGYIESASNSYQVNFSFDQALAKRLSASGLVCTPATLSTPDEIISLVGRDADFKVALGPNNERVVVEIEKAQKEKILRDFVKLLLFLDEGSADFGLLICPRNYAHGTGSGIWRIFDTARQVTQALVQAAEIPAKKADRIALIGYTQEIFINGEWRIWSKDCRCDFQGQAKSFFQAGA